MRTLTRTAAAAASALALAASLAACGPTPPAEVKAPPAAAPPAGAKAGGLQVTGVVRSITRPPRPGSVPYKDALVAAHLADVKATGGQVPSEVLVYTWGMRDNRTTAAADVNEGARVTLALTPWEDVEDAHGSINRIELSDEGALALPPYWTDSL